MDIQYLVVEACKLGAKGIQVIGWTSPVSATNNPNGNLICITPDEPKTASDVSWFNK